MTGGTRKELGELKKGGPEESWKGLPAREKGLGASATR